METMMINVFLDWRLCLVGIRIRLRGSSRRSISTSQKDFVHARFELALPWTAQDNKAGVMIHWSRVNI